MKVVILAGGFGTRISEESHLVPKPMLEIGGQPILWHIMKQYSYYGYNDFVICCGYKADIIKKYFADYYMLHCDVTFDFNNKNSIQIHEAQAEPWKVTVVDTGLDTMTGGRIKRIQKYIGNETFMLTYGDGLCDVDINELVKYHKDSNQVVTITAIQPGSKFGVLDIGTDKLINKFTEKSKEDGGFINGGYMVLEPEIFDQIEGDNTTLEKESLEYFANNGKIKAFCHYGFWQCMDTLRDKNSLEHLWKNNEASWKVW